MESHQERTLVLPVPTSKNIWQRCHWSKRSSTKRRWQDQVWAQVNSYPRWPRPAASVIASMHVFWDKPGVMPDSINLDMAHECVADGLVKAGILLDDRTEYQRGTFAIERVPRGSGRTEMALVLTMDG